ncbi:MAG: U32 family peptidase [Candidatus Methylacidiphilales bacterium]|nr:U32 family peptidase [Candidatus Methylacidiphilales bacterium]
MADRPELLAPAGDWECVRAAVANGADAVFFGLPRFNARLRADNFTEADLSQVVDFLHNHRKKAYVTLNTLVFTKELPDLEDTLLKLQEAGVDAIIVQDLGVARLARLVAPDVEVHASTQMTITSPEGARFAASLGVTRIVLARELSMREMARFRDPGCPPLEVFVHGALCVAYSGQCLTSESLGQRSANRGECAQACRLPYQLVVDGAVRDLGDKRYLLSPQDLAAVEHIPELIRLGVASFKIEGRLKSPEYVAAVCQVYRKAIDAALAASEDGGRTTEDRGNTVTDSDRYQLEMAFSRGLSSGWMHGVNHQELVHARYGKKRGAFLGLVESAGPDHLKLKTFACRLQPGDGLVIDTGGDTEHEQGGRVYEIRGTRLYFEHGKIRFPDIPIGSRVWKTDDPQLNKALRQTFSREIHLPANSIDVTVSGKMGQPLRLSCSGVTVTSQIPLQKAERRPLSEQTLRDQLGRLGGTPFSLGKLDLQLEPGLILPLSELNRLRRELVDQLPIPDPGHPRRPGQRVLQEKLSSIIRPPSSVHRSPALHVLCRTMEQLETAVRAQVPTVYLDFEDIRRYREAVVQARAWGASQIYLATPRIQKSAEEGFFRLIENAQPDGVLVRNLGGLEWFRERQIPFLADFSLNVANPLTAALLMEHGPERLTVSYDLNADQVRDLLVAAPATWFEITLHQHMPMFHMEHCVFAAFLSKGKDYTDCGRPCEKHDVRLRDRVGLLHPLKADVGCRNTVYHGKAQSGAAYAGAFMAQGVRDFRIELLDEDGPRVDRILDGYRKLLAGEVQAQDLLGDLHAASQLGVTSGTLTVLG